MKKHIIACSLLAAIAGTTHAAETTKYDGWVGGFAEYYNADNDKPKPVGYLTNGHGIGGEIGFRFRESLGLRFEYSSLDIDTDKTKLGSAVPNNSGQRMGADVLFFLDNDLLYWFGGVKYESIGNKGSVGNVGLGKHWAINDDWRVITEAALYHDFGERFRNYGVKVGLAYTWGAKASKPMAPADSDRDGVYDSVDQCANTPMGTQVDATGCNIDADGDGVLNSMDKCPNTPVGTAVDAMGCNNDLDGDGILNDIDKCPDTPAGTVVGAKGCSLEIDSDQDGILDQDDQCADTPLTDLADATGCSIFVDEKVKMNLEARFAISSAEISNEDAPKFVEFAEFMNRFPNTQAVIEGHSSQDGPAVFNQVLSEKRANSVKQLMIDTYGIAAERLVAVGYGEERLLDTANTREAHKVNRRIEAVVTAIQKVKLKKD
jgi:OOP family OmpA-OmpF porin